jgi:hypothetical protein
MLLRGLGGAVVAAPFLPSLTDRGARAAGAGDPKRLIVMFTHYGCLTDRWFPVNSHGPLVAEDLLGTSLEVLSPHVNKLLMPRGIRAMNEWNAQMSRGQGNDPHTQVVGTYFTGVPVTPNSNDPFSFEETTKFLAMPTAASLDHVAARQLQPGGVPLLLQVGGRVDNAQSGISYSASETPFAGKTSLVDAFGALTGLFRSDSPTSPDSYRALRGQSVIDLIRDELDALERFDLSAADRQKLEIWKELLDQTGSAAAVSAQCSEEGALALGLSSANFEAASAVPEDGDSLTIPVAGGLDGADLFSNIAVLSALCDAHRVIVLKYPGSYFFRGLGLTVDSHTLSHRVGNASMQGGCLVGVNDMLQTIDRYYAAKFARLVATLDAFDEGSGTLLDNTATVWFQEMSDGHQHNLNNLPILQAGSCGGYFKTGHAVNVEDGAPDLSRGNSARVCETSEQPTPDDTTGTPPEFANAPINKYFCALMNAIGVKAGSDGFPMEGGTQEVTHFGMYDRTEDFVGGGTNPPLISDPGELSALRA